MRFANASSRHQRGTLFTANPIGWGLLVALILHPDLPANAAAVFDVRNYGATGKKADDARPALQQAIDACAAAAGGTVRLPPGEYTSGTLHLRSRVSFDIEAGATLFAARDPKSYDYGQIPSKAALFYGENVESVVIAGQGTVDGQAEYEWRPDDFEEEFDHKTLMQTLGRSLLRPFPKDFPKRQVFPHLLWLGRSRDVRVTGLKWLHAPSWTMALYDCEQTVFDHLYIFTSLKEGVWADGIDLDGCRQIVVSNCTIETGDDCVVFISADSWGPALPCESITVTNCRLSSASAGVKFSEGNRAGVRNILVANTVFTNVNRGFVFSTTLGGSIAGVVLSDLTIDCNRFDWFWSGDAQPFYFRSTRLSEFNHEPAKPGEPPPGAIHNITIRNVTARAKGTSRIYGHAESWLDGISLDNVSLSFAADRSAPYDRADHALRFRWAKNVRVRNLQVSWERPQLEQWKSALCFEEVNALQLEEIVASGSWPERDEPVVAFNQVSDATVRHSRALDGSGVFLGVTGRGSRGICLQSNDLRRARIPYEVEKNLEPGVVKAGENILR